MSDWLWTNDEAEKATGGTSSAPWKARGVAFDSRAVVDDDLFVALKGETSDGHGYVVQAFRNGAAAALVERRPEDTAGAGQSALDDGVRVSAGIAPGKAWREGKPCSSYDMTETF